MKPRAGFFNAIAIGLIGFAVLRPLTEDPATIGLPFVLWGLAGLASHQVAHYLLGQRRREVKP